MKRFLYIISGMLIFCNLASCGKMYQYRDLDGLWQARRIEYADGTVEEPRDLFYSFQLHIIQVKRQGKGEAYGRFEYLGDSIHVHLDGMTPRSVGIFAMNDTVQHFQVEKNDDSRLILKSGYARLSFRKY